MPLAAGIDHSRIWVVVGGQPWDFYRPNSGHTHILLRGLSLWCKTAQLHLTPLPINGSASHFGLLGLAVTRSSDKRPETDRTPSSSSTSLSERCIALCCLSRGTTFSSLCRIFLIVAPLYLSRKVYDLSQSLLHAKEAKAIPKTT
jgi:hypothetical protein